MNRIFIYFFFPGRLVDPAKFTLHCLNISFHFFFFVFFYISLFVSFFSPRSRRMLNSCYFFHFSVVVWIWSDVCNCFGSHLWKEQCRELFSNKFSEICKLVQIWSEWVSSVDWSGCWMKFLFFWFFFITFLNVWKALRWVPLKRIEFQSVIFVVQENFTLGNGNELSTMHFCGRW